MHGRVIASCSDRLTTMGTMSSSVAGPGGGGGGPQGLMLTPDYYNADQPWLSRPGPADWQGADFLARQHTRPAFSSRAPKEPSLLEPIHEAAAAFQRALHRTDMPEGLRSAVDRLSRYVDKYPILGAMRLPSRREYLQIINDRVGLLKRGAYVLIFGTTEPSKAQLDKFAMVVDWLGTVGEYAELHDEAWRRGGTSYLEDTRVPSLWGLAAKQARRLLLNNAKSVAGLLLAPTYTADVLTLQGSDHDRHGYFARFASMLEQTPRLALDTELEKLGSLSDSAIDRIARTATAQPGYEGQKENVELLLKEANAVAAKRPKSFRYLKPLLRASRLYAEDKGKARGSIRAADTEEVFSREEGEPVASGGRHHWSRRFRSRSRRSRRHRDW